ncbi:MAG: TetR/AcrR family transcriptional regulator [Planctomycetota bacterium]|nr:TetR/AcrR family transcriptional regulator [Planctomycetota bacterium]
MTKTAKTPRMKAPDRRRQLLEAAIDCFAEYGYRGTTTARLSKAARVSEPVLYRHFASKHDLFVALLDRVGREVRREWRKAILPLSSPMDQLRVLLRLNPATTDPRTKLLYQVIFSAQAERNEPAIQIALKQHYEQYARFLTNIIKRAQRAGHVRADVSASGLAWQLVHAAIGFAMIKPLEIPGHATPAFVEQAIGLLMEQLAGPGPKG